MRLIEKTNLALGKTENHDMQFNTIKFSRKCRKNDCSAHGFDRLLAMSDEIVADYEQLKPSCERLATMEFVD